MSNNFIRTTSDIWNTLEVDYGNYIPTNNSRDIHGVTILPLSPILIPNPIPARNRSSTHYPWQQNNEGRLLITDFPGLDSIQLPPRPPLAFNNLRRDTPAISSYQWPLSMRDSPNIPYYEQVSRMTQEDQKNVLKKLRKEVYNPAPKNMFRRLCLYYRDHSDKKTVNEDEDGKSCAVCLEDFEPREMVMLTPCNHMFHEDCIVPWVKSHGKCPVCRHQLHDPARGNGNSFNDNNGMNTEPNDQSIGDLLSIIRGMEETMISRNRAR